MISPAVSMWLNIGLTVMAAVANGSVQLTGIVPAGVAHDATVWTSSLLTIYGIVNAGLHGVSSSAQGPLAANNSGPSA
jgi:hypothetical protein